MNKKVFIVITLVSVFIFLSSVSACSCIARAYTASERLAESDGVIVAEVLDVSASGFSTDKTVELNVRTSYKGIPVGRAVIYTPQDSAGCGYEFTKGETYLIYTMLDETERMYTGLCAGTSLAREVEQTIEELDKATGMNIPGAGVVCTQEAMLCPDGSYVGRNSANNCAFDPCPMAEQPNTPTIPQPMEEKGALRRFWNWFTELFR